MLILDKLDSDQLADQSIFDEINTEIDRYIEMDNISDAKDLLDILNGILKSGHSSELSTKYSEVVIKLKYICLSLLSEREVENLLGNKLLLGLKMNIDIFGKLDILFDFFRDSFIGFETHKLFSRSVGNNHERLGKNKINISNEGKLSNPTLANWIRDFSSTLTNNRIPSYLDEAEYINSNKNVKSLNESEKNIIKNVLRLYNYLRFPVRMDSKVKETGHHVGQDKTKAENDVKVDKSFSQPPLELLKQKYNEYRRNRWNILRIEDEILVSTKGDIDLIKKELSLAARQVQKDRLIAGAKILARQNSLIDALGSSPAWVSALGENIVSKYSSQNEPDDIAEIISNIKENINSPAVISEFLQYLLKDKLKMSENDSALVATDIGQLLGDEYQTMAFGNQSTGGFEWTKSKIENHSLVLDIS